MKDRDSEIVKKLAISMAESIGENVCKKEIRNCPFVSPEKLTVLVNKQ